MDNLLAMLIILVVVIGLLAGAVFSVRYFTNAITPVNLVEPTPGIQCATMVGGDGVAIDCWQKIN